MNPELPDDYHEQKVRERNAFLKWLGKAAAILVALVLLDHLVFGYATIGTLFTSLVTIGFLVLLVQLIDAITSRSVSNNKD